MNENSEKLLTEQEGNWIEQQSKDKSRPLVLYYGLDSNLSAKLENLLAEMNTRGKKLTDQDLTMTIGCLAEIPDCQPVRKTSSEALPGVSFAIIHNMDDQKINQFLTMLRSDKSLTIDLKAVVTEHNRSWDCLSLVRELRREHQVMQAFMSARSALSAALQWQEMIRSSENLVSFVPLAEELDSLIDKSTKIIQKGERGEEMDVAELTGVRQQLINIMQDLSKQYNDMDS